MIGRYIVLVISDGHVPWATGQLRTFVLMMGQRTAQATAPPSVRTIVNSLGTSEDAVTGQAMVVEKLLDRVMPHWRQTVPEVDGSRWSQHREAAVRAIGLLEQQKNLRTVLREDVPTLEADRLHPWVWEGARSMWHSRHYRQGVVDALKKVTAEAQNKTGRHALSEADLFTQLFSANPPQPSEPRLRLMDADGSKTFDSVHRGARALAEGLFAGIRNVVAHTVAETEVDEQRALEQLAAVSVLARWVDEAVVMTEP